MSTAQPAHAGAGSGTPVLCGLLAEFDSPGALVTAAERVRDAGYARWDTHSPFPIHGIDAAMGIRPTRLPWIVFVCGVAGCLSGLVLQGWTNASNAENWVGLLPVNFQGYDYLISDKPKFSLPAFIPVIFELTILFSAFAAVFGMLAMNNLPLWHRPLFRRPRFRRVTNDRFFISVDARDPQFDAQRTARFLESLGSTAVERLEDDSQPARFPRGLVIGATILVCLGLLPPLLAAKSRYALSSQTRLNLVADMDNQERYITQRAHPLFADHRAMRPVIPGTLARGDLREDPHFFDGKVGVELVTTFPPQLPIDAALVRRGQERFNIYCAPCHGLGGLGDGTVHRRALRRGTPGWVQPTSLLDPLVLERPVGHLFGTITNGLRTMPAYGDQIAEADRWAIVAYVRALQRSQNARLEEVPPEIRSELR